MHYSTQWFVDGVGVRAIGTVAFLIKLPGAGFQQEVEIGHVAGNTTKDSPV